VLTSHNTRVAASSSSSTRYANPVACVRPLRSSRNVRRALHVVAEANKRGPQPAAAQVRASELGVTNCSSSSRYCSLVLGFCLCLFADTLTESVM